MDKINELINHCDILISNTATYSDPDFKSWHYDCKKTLSDLFGKESIEIEEFLNIQFFIPDTYDGDNSDICAKGLSYSKVFLSKIQENVSKPNTNDYVFIVHGHDEEFKQKVARFLEKLDIPPIILNEEKNLGNTIIEKFEHYAGKVKTAIVLFTPDDICLTKDPDNIEKRFLRARQNVIFEAGYFIAMLGRKNVIIILSDESIEIPSDLSGMVYISSFDELSIARELSAMGFDVDLNKLK